MDRNALDYCADDLETLIGPRPERAIAALADLGLDEAEIARYYRVDRSVVHWLHQKAAHGSETRRRTPTPTPPAAAPAMGLRMHRIALRVHKALHLPPL